MTTEERLAQHIVLYLDVHAEKPIVLQYAEEVRRLIEAAYVQGHDDGGAYGQGTPHAVHWDALLAGGAHHE